MGEAGSQRSYWLGGGVNHLVSVNEPGERGGSEREPARPFEISLKDLIKGGMRPNSVRLIRAVLPVDSTQP